MTEDQREEVQSSRVSRRNLRSSLCEILQRVCFIKHYNYYYYYYY